MVDLNPIAAEPEPAFDPITDMFFLLFTRSNPTVGQRITFDVQSIVNSNFRRGAGTRFLTHGWTSSSESGENVFTRDEFLARADYNVIGNFLLIMKFLNLKFYFFQSSIGVLVLVQSTT